MDGGLMDKEPGTNNNGRTAAGIELISGAAGGMGRAAVIKGRARSLK